MARRPLWGRRVFYCVTRSLGGVGGAVKVERKNAENPVYIHVITK